MSQDNFCILPFIHTAVEANGEVKGCCLTPSFKEESGQKFNVNKNKLDSIVECSDYQRFVESFKNNERHSYCEKCWFRDDTGSISNRQKANRKFRHLIDETKENLQTKIQFIELKLGNKCNLKCRICSPLCSAPWGHEMHKLTGNDIYLDSIKNSGWVEDPEFWNSEVLANANEFHLMGGEPFLDKTHIDFLDRLERENKKNRINIWYNTNGTVFNKELMEKLIGFKGVNISFSIDDVGERFEYQRFPGKWEKVLETICKISEYNKFGFTSEMDICWNLQNIPYFEEIVTTYESELKKYFSRPRTVAEGKHFYNGDIYCPQILKPPQKERLLVWLNTAKEKIPVSYLSLLERVITHVSIQREGEGLLADMKRKIIQTDKCRDQQFLQAHERVRELLSLY